MRHLENGSDLCYSAIWKHLQVSKETRRLWTSSTNRSRVEDGDVPSNDSKTLGLTPRGFKNLWGSARAAFEIPRILRGNHTERRFSTESNKLHKHGESKYMKYAIQIAERLHVATGSSLQWHACRAASMRKGNSSTAFVSSGSCSINVLYKAAVMSLTFRTAAWGCVKCEDT